MLAPLSIHRRTGIIKPFSWKAHTLGTKCLVQSWWYVQGRAGDYHTGTQKANSGGPDLVKGTPVAHLREGWTMCPSSLLPVSPSLIQLSPKQSCTLSFPDLGSWSFWHSDPSRHETQNLRPGKDWQGGAVMWVSRGATLNWKNLPCPRTEMRQGLRNYPSITRHTGHHAQLSYSEILCIQRSNCQTLSQDTGPDSRTGPSNYLALCRRLHFLSPMKHNCETM